MADNKTKTGKTDRIRINFKERYERDYWRKKWSITADQLLNAHKKMGSVLVKDIEAYLKDARLIE